MSATTAARATSRTVGWCSRPPWGWGWATNVVRSVEVSADAGELGGGADPGSPPHPPGHPANPDPGIPAWGRAGRGHRAAVDGGPGGRGDRVGGQGSEQL